MTGPGLPDGQTSGRRAWRVAWRIAVAAVAVVVAAAALVLLLLQADPVATRAVNLLTGRYSPWSDASLTVSHARLRGIGHLSVTGLRLATSAGADMVTIDSLRIHLRPMALLGGTLDIPSLHVAGAQATLRQRADSTFQLLEPFISTVEDAAEDGPFRIVLGEGTITRSRVEAHLLASTGSVLRIEALEVGIADLIVDDGFDMRLDTLGARLHPPERPDGPAQLSARLTLRDGMLSADHFLLTSDSSRVSARGTMVLPGAEASYVSSLDFQVIAEPLDFRDISALVPAVPTAGSLRFEGQVWGSSLLTEFEAEGRAFDGGSFHVTGAFTPTARDSLHYQVRATVNGFQPARWMASAPMEGPIDAELTLALGGRHLDSLDGTASLHLGPLRVAETAFAPTVVQATMRAGAAQYTVRGGLPGLAEFTGSGSLRPLDPMGVATLAAEIRQLADTTIGPVRLAGTRATILVTWARATGATTLAARMQGDAGAASLNADARLRGELPPWTITRLSVADLDISRLNAEWPASRINGSLGGSGRGWSPAELTATSAVVIAPSVIGGERIDTATVAVALSNGVVTMRGNARAPRGVAAFSAAVEPFGEVMTFSVDSLRFRDFVLDTATTGDDRPRLAGVLTAGGSLPPGAIPQFSGELELDPSRWHTAQFEGGRVTFAIVGAEATAAARLRTAQGAVTFDGTAQLVRSDTGGIRIVSGAGSGAADLPDLAALLGWDSVTAGVNAQFALRADGADPLVTTWVADVAATGHYAAVTVDTFRLDGRLAAGVLHLDTLLLRSNVATGDGSGVLALTDQATPPDSAALHIRIVADTGIGFSEMVSLERYSLRGGSLTLDATNSSGGIDAEARVLVLGLISAGPWADSLQVDGTARIEGRSLTALSATIAGSDVGYGRTHLQGLEGTVDHEGGQTEFDLTVVGDDRHNLRMAGTALPRDRSVTLAEMDVALDDRGWSLVEAATIVYAPRLVVRNFTLRDGEQQLVIDGTIDRQGSQDLAITFRNFPLQGFAEFAGYDGLDGELDGTVRLSGPASRVAVASTLDLRLMGTTGSITLTPAGGDRLEVAGRLEDEGGHALVVEGSLPFILSLAEGPPSEPAASGALALTVTADTFALGWLEPLVRPRGVERLEGALTADLRVTGTYGDPVMAGTAFLQAGRFDFPRQGVAYQDVAGEFTFAGPLITVTSLRATSEGTAVASGTIRMLDAGTPRLELEARFEEFRAVRNEWGRFGVSGQVEITGDLMAPVFTGAVQLVNSDIYADPVGQGGAGQAVTLSPEDLQMLEAYFGYRFDPDAPTTDDLLEGMALNLDVTLGSNTWLRRRSKPEMRIELDGSIDVRKAANDSIMVFGTIEVLPERSYFEQFGRRFNLSAGTVTFNGPMMGWIADFQAQYPVPSTEDASAPQVVITLQVQGGLEDLNLTLGSEPSMETSDMLSYLATGRPAASAAAFGGGGEGGIGGFGASFAAGQLAGVLEESAAEHIGLDVIEIRHNGIKGATVVAGRYVTPRLFVGFEQPLTLRSDDDEAGRTAEQSSEVRLEYSAYRWLVLHLQQGRSRFQFFLRIRRSF